MLEPRECMLQSCMYAHASSNFSFEFVRQFFRFLLIIPLMDSASPDTSDLQAALFGGGGPGGRARSLHLLQRYILHSQQDVTDNDHATVAATTTAIETLCTHFLSCVTPNTNAQHLLISAISAHVLSFPSVAAACQRLSSNFAHRNHVISWVHTIIACLRCSSTPPPCQGGRAMLQSLLYHMLQVIFSDRFCSPHFLMTAYQELVKWASLYIDACNDVHMDQAVIMLLDACRLPSVVVCCGDSGVGATVLIAAVQVLLLDLLFLLLLDLLLVFHSGTTC